MLLHMGIPIWNHNQMNVNPIFNNETIINGSNQTKANKQCNKAQTFLFHYNFKHDNKATKLNKKFDIHRRSFKYEVQGLILGN